MFKSGNWDIYLWLLWTEKYIKGKKLLSNTVDMAKIFKNLYSLTVKEEIKTPINKSNIE